MKVRVFAAAIAVLLSAQAGAHCEIYKSDHVRSTAPQTVTEGVLASFELTRQALRRQAYMDCIAPELKAEMPEIELERIDVEYTVEDQPYPEARNAVARN